MQLSFSRSATQVRNLCHQEAGFLVAQPFQAVPKTTHRLEACATKTKLVPSRPRLGAQDGNIFKKVFNYLTLSVLIGVYLR
jgi:hypothetical protein